MLALTVLGLWFDRANQVNDHLDERPAYFKISPLAVPPVTQGMSGAPPATGEWHVVLFYRYCPVADPDGVAAAVTAAAGGRGMCGRVLVADEGVNGTVAAPGPGPLAEWEAAFEAIAGADLAEMDWKHSCG